MTYFVQRRWGDSEDEPTEAKMRECLAELDTPDREHPDTWLQHESGWTLAVYENGLLVWENLESDGDPRHLPRVSREEAIRLWLLLSRGELDEIESLPWQAGYGPSLSDEERQKLQREAAEFTLKLERDFYDSLGPEDRARPCRKEGCDRGTVKFSAFCRPHHFESLRKQPCPFDD